MEKMGIAKMGIVQIIKRREWDMEKKRIHKMEKEQCIIIQFKKV